MQLNLSDRQPKRVALLVRVFWLLMFLFVSACAGSGGDTENAQEATQIPDIMFEDDSIPWDSPIGQSGAFSGGLFSRNPVLSIVYTAEANGELYPCETCRGPSFGGLARRAGMISRLRTDPVPMLTIIGPNEFWVDQDLKPSDMFSMGNKGKNLVDAKILFEAYNSMNADAVYLSTKAASFFTEAGVTLPDSFVTVGEEPVGRLIEYGQHIVGLVFFTDPRDPSPEAMAKAQRMALDKGRELYGQATLVIGISPWGTAAEQEFTDKAGDVFHVILGGGKGMGFPYALPAQEFPTLWCRPDSSGRSLNMLRIYQWPESGFWRWKAGLNFEGSLSPLGANIPEDPHISSILPKAK